MLTLPLLVEGTGAVSELCLLFFELWDFAGPQVPEEESLASTVPLETEDLDRDLVFFWRWKSESPRSFWESSQQAPF